MRSRNLGLSNLKTWEEVDRQFTWLASIYSTVEEKAETLAEQSQELQHNLKEQRQLKSQISSQIDKIQNTKDKLLQDKLTYLHRMQEVRAKRLAKEEQLKMIQETVKDLQYKLKLLTTRQFAQLKGHIPWPARGNIVVSFSPSANPPQRGLGMALSSKQDIQAVSWGKVVHNDQLRGFGHVVILFHGQDYYSLYAYLSNSRVRTGQDVEKGEILGQAGFYPPAKGPGLYFELRFRQKAINPKVWLKG
jgi:septal ring factor EnvC (AmiA/AmiB activator)